MQFQISYHRLFFFVKEADSSEATLQPRIAAVYEASLLDSFLKELL